MTIDQSEAATSLQDIATVERRTREAVFYAGSSAIFIMWGVLVACGYGLTELYPRSARVTWVFISTLGCAATALIVVLRMRARARETRDWRVIWAMIALTAFGAAWSYLLGPIVPRQMMYAFQPSLFLLGLILAGSDVSLSFSALSGSRLSLSAISRRSPGCDSGWPRCKAARSFSAAFGWAKTACRDER
jgi:hypothetical protein